VLGGRIRAGDALSAPCNHCWGRVSAAQGAGYGAGGMSHAGHHGGGMAHQARRRVTATVARQRAGDGAGGTPLPVMAQAARATCRLARGAATHRGSFLTIFSAGGLF
jgi:hypothetical protein